MFYCEVGEIFWNAFLQNSNGWLLLETFTSKLEGLGISSTLSILKVEKFEFLKWLSLYSSFRIRTNF